MSSEDKTYPLTIDYIPEEYLEVARKELNETTEKTVCFIRDLKNMIKADKTLKDIDFHPDFLHQFLRITKYNVDAAFKRLYKFTNMRKKFSSFFTGVQDRISTSPSYKWVSPLPWRSYDGCTVFVIKFGIWDYDISFEHLNRLVHVVIHQSLRIPLTQIKGLRAILDFGGTSWRHLKYVTPSNALQVAQMHLECTPARFRNFHCVNCSLAMKIAYGAIYPFISDKLRNRMIFHKNMEELSQYFPKHSLPVEYGGDIKDYYMYSWMKEANDQMGQSTPSGQGNIC